MLKKFAALGVLALSLSGCNALYGNDVTDTLLNKAMQLDNVLPTLVMEKAAALHNLSVGLAAINAAPGMVTMTSSVSTTAPVVPAAPVVMPVPVVTAPTSTMPIPTGPTSNG